MAIFLFLRDLNFEFNGFANASLHLENPNFNNGLAVILLFVAACSAKTFSPTIPRSATPLDTREGMSSSLTSNISIFIFEDLAKRRSPFSEKLIPDLINRFLLFS